MTCAMTESRRNRFRKFAFVFLQRLRNPGHIADRLDVTSPALFIVLAILVIANTLFVPQQARPMLGIPLALFVPGHAALAMLLGNRLDLEFWQRLLLRMAVSLAMYPILAIVVFTFRGRFRPATVSGSVAMCCLLAAAFEFRRRMTPAIEPYPLLATCEVSIGDGGGSWTVRAPRTRQTLRFAERHLGHSVSRSGVPGEFGQDRPFSALILIMTIGLAGGAMFAARAVLPHTAHDEYSAFTLAGTWGQLDTELPVSAGKPISIEVSVLNRSHHSNTYVVWARQFGIHSVSRRVNVEAQDSWTGTVQVLPGKSNPLLVSGGSGIAGGTCDRNIVLGLDNRQKTVGQISIPIIWPIGC